MNADIFAPAPLADFIDAQGRRVTVEVTRSGLAAVLTRTPDEGLNGGHPALNRANVAELRDALNDFLARDES